jgi:hypothetical protein
MIKITKHSKERIVERDTQANNFAEAKKVAKQAYASGKTINQYQDQPQFFRYLQNKKSQANSCVIRVYRDNIYIWRGKGKSLVTAYPIPDRFKEAE